MKSDRPNASSAAGTGNRFSGIASASGLCSVCLDGSAGLFPAMEC